MRELEGWIKNSETFVIVKHKVHLCWWLKIIWKRKVGELCDWRCIGVILKRTSKLWARILGWVPFPSPKDLPDPWIQPRSPALQADS